MTKLRNALTVLAAALLTLGWAAAAWAAMGGSAAEWANRIDGPAAGGVRALALTLLSGAIVLAFVPNQEPEP